MASWAAQAQCSLPYRTRSSSGGKMTGRQAGMLCWTLKHSEEGRALLCPETICKCQDQSSKYIWDAGSPPKTSFCGRRCIVCHFPTAQPCYSSGKGSLIAAVMRRLPSRPPHCHLVSGGTSDAGLLTRILTIQSFSTFEKAFFANIRFSPPYS